MIWKFFVLSLRNIRHRKLRSWLTILGIIVGIALIVSLISMGRGLEQGIMQQLQMFGSDLITIMPGEESDPMMGLIGGGMMRDKEIDVLKGIPGTNLVIPFDMGFYSVEFKGEAKSTTIHGSPIKETQELYTKDRGMGVDTGRWPYRENVSEVLLGSKISEEKFREKIYVGDEIRVKGKKFKVVGILEEIGSSEDDNAVYMSLYNLRKITGSQNTVKMAMVRADKEVNQEMIAEEIKYRVRKERGSADITVITSEKAQKMVGDIIGTIQLAVLFIAVFSIIVGGIGVMNTMYTSVLERRREIGIMKAVGAKKIHILSIFVIESGMIGMFGGVVGFLIGYGLAKCGEIGAKQAGFKFLEAYISPGLVIGILAFAFFLGVISGFLPARQASKMNPSVALRYE